MSTKLSRFCLGVMEAAWLAAVSLVPIFFNIYSSRIFEPDKITILRSLALLILAAWVVKLVDEGGVKWQERNRDISLFKYLWNYPLIAPVIGIIVIYSLSTIFSVTPLTSFFGSYQRLQGTYTTFSYLIIFFSIIVHLRKPQQVNRLITTVIIASLPVSLYGLLQRFNIDPIPWGGDVSIRIASDMGNSIFVAAYMIMIFPLTLGRILESFKAILTQNDDPGIGNPLTIKNIIRATIYIFIGALELIAIYMSGSRGPLLGLMAGIYILVLLLSIYWRKRWMTYSIISLAIIGGIFLAVFNMSNGPLEALKKSPAIGRFGNLLNSESNSALVRQYIWEGTVKLVGIHTPLKFPDGSTDNYNFLRPLIGYGPESMYVAYNQFYQPQLGQVEKRNASPDRSHNETWDSIVITGISGLLTYLAVFSSIFYFGLKWQGLIKSHRNKVFFLICLVGGGLLGTIAMIFLRGVEYLGVGLPFGMIIGVIVYLTIYAVLTRSEDVSSKNNPFALLMIVLFAAVVGHFVEINFGIAIVATRTLFWSYTGLILVVGFVMPKADFGINQSDTLENTSETNAIPVGKKKDRRNMRLHRRSEQGKRLLLGDQPDWVRNALIGGLIVGTILATLGYNYITNSDHSTSFVSIIVNSLTRLDNKNNAFSLGILALLVTSWIIGAFLFNSEIERHPDTNSFIKSQVVVLVVSIMIGVFFWILHGISLAALAGFKAANQNDVITQVDSIGSLLTKLYLYIFLIFVVLALFLPEEWPARSVSLSYTNIILAPIILILTAIFINTSNLRVIHADVTFKMADPFTKSGQWDGATFLYKRALQLTPNEDHYYLFLGRSYLEQAKLKSTAADQDALVIQAEKDLKVAQSINPLNTDHTANLARLYTWWASQAANTADRSTRAEKASNYYATAVTLSPNNSTLWDEWGVLFMQVIGDFPQALDRLQHALSLDARYNFTQGLLGDYYLRLANTSTDTAQKKESLTKALGYYQTGANVTGNLDANPKAGYLVSMTNVYLLIANLDPNNIDRGILQQAVTDMLNSIQSGVSSSDLWKVQEALAKLYLELGDKANSQYYAEQALIAAPTNVTSRIQELITQSLTLP